MDSQEAKERGETLVCRDCLVCKDHLVCRDCLVSKVCTGLVCTHTRTCTLAFSQSGLCCIAHKNYCGCDFLFGLIEAEKHGSGYHIWGADYLSWYFRYILALASWPQSSSDAMIIPRTTLQLNEIVRRKGKMKELAADNWTPFDMSVQWFWYSITATAIQSSSISSWGYVEFKCANLHSVQSAH